MLLLNNNELQHVDSSSDILEHYGVKGMHWGTKKGKRITAAVNRTEGHGAKSIVSAYGKGVANQLRHPLASTRSIGSTVIKHPIMAVTSPNTTAKMVNKKTRERLDGRAKKRSEYLKKKNTGAKATLYKGLNALNNADKQVSKVFDKTIRYSNNGNHKEMTKYENSKYDSVNSRYDKKAAKRAGKDAWKKALDDKKLNRQIEKTWSDYNRVDKEKVGLFDRNGRKDKKKRLNDLHKTGYMLEDKLFEKAEKAKRKATKKL